jgi:hypothetical protein
MVFLTLDKESRRDFWRRSFSFKRISGLWWAIIFLLFPILYSLSIFRHGNGRLPEMTQLRSHAYPLMIPLAAFISFMSGPWSEDRMARLRFDRILTPFGLLAGSISLTTLGRLAPPLFFIHLARKIGFGTGFWTFMLRSVGLALLMNGFLNTNRSMFMHFTSNFTGQCIRARGSA